MSRRERLAAGIATLLVAGNLGALIVALPLDRPKPGAVASRARAHARARTYDGTTAQMSEHTVRASVPLRTRARKPLSRRRHRSSAAEAALRRARQFAALYARYRDHRLDSAGTRRLRRVASLALTQLLTAQPALGAAGLSPRLRPGGDARLALLTARAAITVTTLVAGSRRHRLRCLLSRGRDGWAIVGFRYDNATVLAS